MRKLTLISLACAMIVAASVSAADQKADSSSVRELKPQTNCPVMGGKIDSAYFTDIQGQRVYHCCPMCSKKLKADPDKYFQKAAAQGVLFENIQKDCPVSGDSLENRNVFTDFQGRRIYFCCKKCVKKFADNPQKYLKVMDAPAEEQPKMEDHMGHMQHGGR